MPWASDRSSFIALSIAAMASSSSATETSAPTFLAAAQASQVHAERDELLLRAVVEVAFDAAALGIGGADDAAT